MSITSVKDIDLELYVATEILHLESLHYGYWRGSENLTLANLKKAQRRYTQTLISWIPNEVKTILDVGSGIGDVARALAANGYIVTAISPDTTHAKYFSKTYQHLTFFNTTFESFTTSQRFDLILMSESQNYFAKEVGFQKCTEVLRPHGYFLVSGKFRKANSAVFSQVTNIESEYLTSARKYGFSLIRSRDITAYILPTLQLAKILCEDYGEPLNRLGKIYASSLTPVQSFLIRFLLGVIFRHKVKQIKETLRLYHEHSQPRLFQKHVKYLRLLFRYA